MYFPIKCPICNNVLITNENTGKSNCSFCNNAFNYSEIPLIQKTNNNENFWERTKTNGNSKLAVDSDDIYEIAELPPINYNGLYSHIFSSYTSFIRFFPDGHVEAISTKGDKKYTYSILNHEFNSNGKYIIKGDTITFSIKSPAGIVNYNGKILEDGSILLNSVSHINGHKAYNLEYKFLECE